MIKLVDSKSDRPEFNRGNTDYVDFEIEKIEEYNHEIDYQGYFRNEIERAYRIYWYYKDKPDEVRVFDCRLGSKTYKRHVLPNLNKVVMMES